MKLNRTVRALVVTLAVGLPLADRGAGPRERCSKSSRTTRARGRPRTKPKSCGFDVEYRVDYKGAFLIRTGKGKQAGAFFLHDNFRNVETFTNPDNGRWFTVTKNVVVQDVKATRVDGPIFEFVTHEVGQVTVRDMNGTVSVPRSWTDRLELPVRYRR